MSTCLWVGRPFDMIFSLRNAQKQITNKRKALGVQQNYSDRRPNSAPALRINVNNCDRGSPAQLKGSSNGGQWPAKGCFIWLEVGLYSERGRVLLACPIAETAALGSASSAQRTGSCPAEPAATKTWLAFVKR